MRALYRRISNFLKRNDGPTAVEYAFMAFLILVACMVAVVALGRNANALHSNNAAKITGSP
jgi:pilus assembly protein Flp/PilA